MFGIEEKLLCDLTFSGTYNLIINDSEIKKYLDFIQFFIKKGSYFFIFQKVGLYKQVSDENVISNALTESTNSFLLISTDTLLKIIKSTKEILNFLNLNLDYKSFFQELENNNNFWITITFPSKNNKVTFITYWDHLPNFINKSNISTNIRFINEQRNYSIKEATNILRNILYFNIDNLFSHILFSIGKFTFPNNQLRKLSFVYIITLDNKLTIAKNNDYDYINLFYNNFLKGSKSDFNDFGFLKLDSNICLTYSCGFVGMTGQPNIDRKPSLQLITFEKKNKANDTKIIKILQVLSNIEKNSSELNTFSEFYIPSIALFLGAKKNKAFNQLQKFHFEHTFKPSITDLTYLRSFLKTELKAEELFTLVNTTNSIITINIPEAISYLLKTLLINLKSPFQSFQEFQIEAFRIITSILPSSILTLINEFKNNSKFSGAILIKNFPIDAYLPETPKDGKRSNLKNTFISEGCLVGLGKFLGEPFGFFNEKEGELIHNICPVKGRELIPSNEGSKGDFEFHTEVAFHDSKPDYLLLFCLREDSSQEALTYISDILDIYKNLNTKTIKILSSKKYLINKPESFKGNISNRPTSVIKKINNEPILCLNLNNMTPIDIEAKEALEILKEILKKNSKSINLKLGDMLIIDNNKCVHGRSSFEAKFDGKDRWLQRLYLNKNIWGKTKNLSYPNRVI